MIRYLIIIGLLSSPVALAAQTYESCGKIDDGQLRLNCFDQVLSAAQNRSTEVAREPSPTESVNEKLETAPIIQDTPILSRQTESEQTAQEQQTGLVGTPTASEPSDDPSSVDRVEVPAGGSVKRDDPNREITATIVSTRKQWPGNHVVYQLDNGESWVQVRAKRIHVRPGDPITIRKRRMSYLLVSKGGASVNVRRL